MVQPVNSNIMCNYLPKFPNWVDCFKYSSDMLGVMRVIFLPGKEFWLFIWCVMCVMRDECDGTCRESRWLAYYYYCHVGCWRKAARHLIYSSEKIGWGVTRIWGRHQTTTRDESEKHPAVDTYHRNFIAYWLRCKHRWIVALPFLPIVLYDWWSSLNAKNMLVPAPCSNNYVVRRINNNFQGRVRVMHSLERLDS